MNSTQIYASTDIAAIASKIVADALQNNCHIFTLQGDLGAGKTTLCKELIRQLGSSDTVMSPTYAYMNRYQAGKREIFHFDLYRLSSQEAFYQAGFDEYLSRPQSVVFIEWPEVIAQGLSGFAVCAIRIEYRDEMSRLISWEVR